ncbi:MULTISPECIES: hypothetical protein [unclassified Streptomyces]|uniref:hypothetical protein n=1 Tax=unclassified Streptomyces TaxID=2593676 RepID=UPI0032501006
MSKPTENRPRDTVVVGFDLGHGETALAVARSDANASPGPLDLPGSSRRQVLTAVAEHDTHGVLIGEAALTTAGVRYLATEFKSERMKEAEARRPVTLVLRRVAAKAVPARRCWAEEHESVDTVLFEVLDLRWSPELKARCAAGPEGVPGRRHGMGGQPLAARTCSAANLAPLSVSPLEM